MGFDEPRLGYMHHVVELRPGGAAEKAGLRVGDVVAAVDSQEVHVLTDLTLLLGRHDVGDAVVLTVVRGAKRQDLAVTIEAPWR